MTEPGRHKNYWMYDLRTAYSNVQLHQKHVQCGKNAIFMQIFAVGATPVFRDKLMLIGSSVIDRGIQAANYPSSFDQSKCHKWYSVWEAGVAALFFSQAKAWEQSDRQVDFKQTLPNKWWHVFIYDERCQQSERQVDFKQNLQNKQWHMLIYDERCQLQPNEANCILLDAGFRLVTLSCMPPVNTAPHGSSFKSFWEGNSRRRGLQPSMELSVCTTS